MNKRLEWYLLVLLAAGGVFLWYRFSLPRFQSLDLSVGQAESLDIAKVFLKTQRGVDINGYKTAVAFNVDEDTDRYLQRTLGISSSQRFIHDLHYDLFCWVIRFFKEKQKEEYRVIVSPASGQVTGFNHVIEDTAFRPAVDKEKARRLGLDFLQKTFAFNPSQYVLHGEEVRKFDHRTEYAFSWQNRSVNIPWDKNKDKGFAKLLTSTTVSGNEILNFNKYQFQIPDGFGRYVDNLKQTGQSLTLIFRVLYLALLTLSIVVVVNRKHQVVNRSVKSFYMCIGIVMFIVMGVDILNDFQTILFGYPTTQSLGNYMTRQLIENVIGPFFIAVAFVMPALAGESLRFEISPEKKSRGFLSALLSSFRSAAIARQIFVGYLAAAIILGAQAFIFDLGFKYCGVWDELTWLTQASTAYLPAFTALVIGFQASFSEESMFRLFAINFFKKYGVPTMLAVFLSAAIWGFGHTGYDIYPMWFRGIEVTCIGIIMGIFYLRFGFMCVIVAHFLIDAFLSSLPYLLNQHLTVDFYTSLGVVCLPLIGGFVALIFDRGAQERPLSVRFNAQQQFNFNLLQELCRHKKPEELVVLKNDLQRFGWDAAIIQRAFDEQGQGT